MAPGGQAAQEGLPEPTRSPRPRWSRSTSQPSRTLEEQGAGGGTARTPPPPDRGRAVGRPRAPPLGLPPRIAATPMPGSWAAVRPLENGVGELGCRKAKLRGRTQHLPPSRLASVLGKLLKWGEWRKHRGGSQRCEVVPEPVPGRRSQPSTDSPAAPQ